MELRLLNYFATLAEELHFSRAAKRLSISQPPLSVAIKQLEEEIGAQLFERTSKGVRLTPAGEHLLPRARQLLTLTQQAVQETRDVGHGVRGHLRLGFVGSALYRGLPQALAAFQEAGATTVEWEKYPEYIPGLSSIHVGACPVAYMKGYLWLDAIAYPGRK